MKKLGLLATALLAVACTPEDDGATGSGSGEGVVIDSADYGGYVSLQAYDDSELYIAGLFLSEVGGSQPDVRWVANDECEIENWDEEESDPDDFTSIDVGESFSVEGQGPKVTAEKWEDSGMIFYDGWGEGAYTSGEYVISVSGSGTVDAGELTSIQLPKPATLETDLAEYTPGQPYEIFFPAETGADLVTIYVEGSLAAYNCSVEPDGSFTLSAELTTAIGEDVYVDVQALTAKKIEFEGRELLVTASNYVWDE